MKSIFVLLIIFLLCSCSLTEDNNSAIRGFIVNDIQSDMLLNMNTLVDIHENRINTAIDTLETQIDLAVCRLWEVAKSSTDEQKQGILEALSEIKKYRQLNPRDITDSDANELSDYFKETSIKANKILSEL